MLFLSGGSDSYWINRASAGLITLPPHGGPVEALTKHAYLRRKVESEVKDLKEPELSARIQALVSVSGAK